MDLFLFGHEGHCRAGSRGWVRQSARFYHRRRARRSKQFHRHHRRSMPSCTSCDCRRSCAKQRCEAPTTCRLLQWIRARVRNVLALPPTGRTCIYNQSSGACTLGDHRVFIDEDRLGNGGFEASCPELGWRIAMRRPDSIAEAAVAVGSCECCWQPERCRRQAQHLPRRQARTACIWAR